MTQTPRFLRRHRKDRQDVTSFKFLVATPATTTVKAPANGRVIFISRSGVSVGTTAGTILTTYGTRTVKTYDTVKTNWLALERGNVVTVSAGFDLWLDSGLAVLKKIIGGA